MKSGFKTSEFWLTLGTVVAKLFIPDLPDEAIWSTAAYAISRGAAKVAKKEEK